MQKDYSGRIGGLCNMPDQTVDQVQVSIGYQSGIKFGSRWTDIPEAKRVATSCKILGHPSLQNRLAYATAIRTLAVLRPCRFATPS